MLCRKIFFYGSENHINLVYVSVGKTWMILVLNVVACTQSFRGYQSIGCHVSLGM